MNIWKRDLDRLGVKILSCKPRSLFARMIFLEKYKIDFSYKNKLYTLNAWAGRYNEDVENLHFSIYKSILDLESGDICEECMKSEETK